MVPSLFSKQRKSGDADASARMLAMIEQLPLDDHQRDFLRDRWWDQITWMDSEAKKCLWWHRSLRILVIVCGVLGPALVSGTISVDITTNPPTFPWLIVLRGSAIVAGLLVAISTGMEELFRFGPRWRHYRQTSEQVRSEGWQFITLSGPYRRSATHAEAFRTFARHVEGAFQQDVDTFITSIFREPEPNREQTTADSTGPEPHP